MSALFLLVAIAAPRSPVIIETDGEPLEELTLPVPRAVHTELDSGLRTTHFEECALCGESLGIAGHDDTDCPQCGEFACSSFGCGRCALLEDVDR